MSMWTTERERLEIMYNALDEAVNTFQWGPAEGLLGDVELDREANMLRLVAFVFDTDQDMPDERGSLLVSMEVDPYMDPRQQIRRLIHFHVTHEADEQMWFSDVVDGRLVMDRPFYPHNEDGSLRDV